MRPFLPALLLTLALSASASGSHCDTYTTSEPEVTIGDPTALGAFPTFYHDQDICWSSGTCMSSYWVYEESNGIPGLQRGDEIVDDTCHGMIESDTVIF